MKVESERREVQVTGHPITYWVAGHGAPVVLIHGLSGSMRWWDPILPSLAAHHGVYMVNLPGFGALVRQRRLPLREVAGWLRAWIEAVGLDHVALIGHSMGGYIAVRLTVESPHLVDHLILVDAAGVPVVRRSLGYTVPLLRAGRVMKPALLPVLAADAMRAGPLTLLRTAGELLGEDIRPDLASLHVPTLLIWGERDALVPLTVGELLHREIRDSQLVVIPRAGHVPMYDNPEAVAEAILPFLDGGIKDSQRSQPGAGSLSR